MMTLLVRILGEGVVHKKDKQDTTPVFLAAQQGKNCVRGLVVVVVVVVCVCVCVCVCGVCV